MTVGILVVEFLIPGSRSLKDKRMELRSLKQRLRNAFNISVAELNSDEKWQRATIGLVTIGGDKKFVNGTLDKAFHMVADVPSIEIIDQRIELL